MAVEHFAAGAVFSMRHQIFTPVGHTGAPSYYVRLSDIEILVKINIRTKGT